MDISGDILLEKIYIICLFRAIKQKFCSVFPVKIFRQECCNCIQRVHTKHIYLERSNLRSFLEKKSALFIIFLTLSRNFRHFVENCSAYQLKLDSTCSKERFAGRKIQKKNTFFHCFRTSIEKVSALGSKVLGRIVNSDVYVSIHRNSLREKIGKNTFCHFIHR